MKAYELELRDVVPTPFELYADWKPLTSNLTEEGGSFSFTLPDRGQPHMFALYLWALDSTQESSNYRTARRFVLVDNTSEVQTSADHPIIPETAYPESDLEWQVNLVPVYLTWKNHFCNDWHIHTNLLLPIRSESNTSQPIEGIFEQETGDLPVSGTPNIDGVTNFMYSFKKISSHGNEVAPFKDVPDPLSQCLNLSETTINDGDELQITIKAIDVMNNTLDDFLTLYIDSSPPIIKDMYLMKDGYRYLFVHDSTDLSKMDMVFSSFDTHRYVKTRSL